MTKNFDHFWSNFLDPHERSDPKSKSWTTQSETGQDSKKFDQKVPKNGPKIDQKIWSKTEKDQNYWILTKAGAKITKNEKVFSLSQVSNQIDHFGQK